MLQDFPGVPQLVAHFGQDHPEGLHDGDDPPELGVVAGLALSHNGTGVLLLPLQDLPCSSLFRPHSFSSFYHGPLDTGPKAPATHLHGVHCPQAYKIAYSPCDALPEWALQHK